MKKIIFAATFATSFVLVAATGMSGCQSAHFAPARLDDKYETRTAPEKIELFRTQSPDKKYKEVGAVNACCSRDTNDLVDMLRKKASEAGGDALIGLEPYSGGGVSASVIRYE